MPRVEIQRYDDLDSGLRSEIEYWDKIVFPAHDTEQEWCEPDWQISVWEGETWVSGVQLFDQVVRVGDKPVRVGGIGSVMTRPDRRRHGYAALAMKAAVDYMRGEVGVPFGLLVCSDERLAYYGRLGWQQIRVSAVYTQYTEERRIGPDTRLMIYQCREDRTWPDGDVDFCSPMW